MHTNYKVGKQVIINIIHRHIKPTKPQKQIKHIIYYTKFKTSNFIVKNNTNFPQTPQNVCTINKSVHTKKSLETYLMILVRMLLIFVEGEQEYYF